MPQSGSPQVALDARRFVRRSVGALLLGLLMFQSWGFGERDCLIGGMSEMGAMSEVGAMAGMASMAAEQPMTPTVPDQMPPCDHADLSLSCQPCSAFVTTTGLPIVAGAAITSRFTPESRLMPAARDIAPDVPPPRV